MDFNHVEALDNLKKLGFTTRIYHHRIVKLGQGITSMTPMADIRALNEQSLIAPRGGKTEIKIIINDNVSITGIAKCNPTDRYERKVGINIALERVYPLALALVNGK